jgi:hypothetical protein
VESLGVIPIDPIKLNKTDASKAIESMLRLAQSTGGSLRVELVPNKDQGFELREV